MVRFWSAGHILTIGTNMAACSSFCCLFLSIVTDSWLCTKERAMVSNGSFVYVTIYSGLWRRCTLDPRSLLPTTFNCSYIGYFTHVERDGIGPTDSILLSLRKATGFPMVGLVLMLVAQTVCFVSHCSLYRQCLTITFGVMFVSGGLLTLVGIIIYIGAITEEAGNKMKSKDEFPFLYFYGPSLVMAIFSFIASQMTGVIAVNLFLSRKRQRIRCANKANANSQQSTTAVVASATVMASLATSGDSKKAVLEAFEGDSRRDLKSETFIMDQKKCIGEDIEVCSSTKQQQQQYHLFHQLQQQQQQQHQQYYNTNEQQNQQQQQHLKRPTLMTSNSVDYYYQHHLPQHQQQHSKKDFIRQESFDVTSAVQIPSQPAPDRFRRLVRNYSEETYSWRIHGSGNITPDRSLENISLSVHRLQQNRGYPKSSSHGRLAQTMARQSSNASRSPDGGMTAKYGSSTLLHRLHQTNQLSRSRLRINNSTVDWPSSILASANQRRVIGSSQALGAEARRERGGARRPEMSRQWSEMTPEEGRLFSQSRDRLRLSHEELNLSHRRITPV